MKTKEKIDKQMCFIDLMGFLLNMQDFFLISKTNMQESNDISYHVCIEKSWTIAAIIMVKNFLGIFQEKKIEKDATTEFISNPGEVKRT